MGDLSQRMHARIGPPRRRNRMRARLKPGQSGFDRALNRRLVLLPLPSGKGRAVIFDFQCIAGHGARSSAGQRARQGGKPLVSLRRRAYLRVDRSGLGGH